MQLGDRLGLAGLLLGFFGAAATLLWPTKRWIGWIFMACGIALGITWGFVELKDHLARTQEATMQLPKYEPGTVGGEGITVTSQPRKKAVAPSVKLPAVKVPTVSTSGAQSPAIGTITQGAGSALSVGQKGGITAVHVTVAAVARIPESKVDDLSGLLPKIPGASVSITVRTTDNDSDAGNMLMAFAKTRIWNTAGVNHLITGTSIGPNNLPIPEPTGIHISARPENLDLARFVQQSLKGIGVESVVDSDKSVGNGIYILVATPAQP